MNEFNQNHQDYITNSVKSTMHTTNPFEASFDAGERNTIKKKYKLGDLSKKGIKKIQAKVAENKRLKGVKKLEKLEKQAEKINM